MALVDNDPPVVVVVITEGRGEADDLFELLPKRSETEMV